MHALRLQEGQIDIRKQGACPAGRRIGRGTETDLLITSSLNARAGSNTAPPLLFYLSYDETFSNIFIEVIMRMDYITDII